MADLTFDPTFTTKSRETAKLEIALDPTASPLAYVLVTTANQLAGFRRDPQVTRTDLFVDGTGASADAISIRHRLGAQAFQVVGNPKSASIKSLILKGSPGDEQDNAVMARYTDAQGMSHQGQAILLFMGEAGNAPNDVTAYDFSVEWIRAGAPTFPV